MKGRVIGRLLVASLHQSIAEVLPARLEFYEEWLRPSELRDGRMAHAPFSAVLSFLRQEGDAYEAIAALAGRYAADWWVADRPPVQFRVARQVPAWARGRLAIRAARSMVAGTDPASLVTAAWGKGEGALRLDHSLFCDVRMRSGRPLCGFYAAALGRILATADVGGEVVTTSCRAVEGDICTLTVAQQSEGVA